ncbi:hypothetical protein SAMN05421770_101460 [Granulicella rosea]|uniref:Ribbon-helix-helix protein, copG family n=1 Tax=Granulicella rosea TaxID=474952 RepID=A0A239DI04_9BACT|nr:hypothetical protein [Granulicella rosea]SNS31508.1 hypothetical protein SAMN05421770_101460 [Granulicella rosea]
MTWTEDGFYLDRMVISLTPEQEARLVQAAQADGISPESLVADIVLEALDFEDEEEEAVLVERRRQFD